MAENKRKEGFRRRKQEAQAAQQDGPGGFPSPRRIFEQDFPEAEKLGPQLLAAAQGGEREEVKSLLRDRADPNSVDEHGETALFEAAASGNLKMVADLLIFGADPNKKSRDGMAPNALTANKDILSLFDRFLGVAVSSDNQESLYRALSPQAARDIQDCLNPRPPGNSIGEMQENGGSPTPLMRRGGFSGLPRKAQAVKPVEVTERTLLLAAKHRFTVVNKKCRVCAEPNVDAKLMKTMSQNGYFHGFERTMNGWLRTEEEKGKDGWVLMNWMGRENTFEVVRQDDPPDDPPQRLELVVPDLKSQGLACLEVRAKVQVFEMPSTEAHVVRTRNKGELIFADRQSFNGWVRLTKKEGWVQQGRVREQRQNGSAALTELLQLRPNDSTAETEVDMWALNEMWYAARKDSKDGLERHVIKKLKKLEEDARRCTREKLRQCKPGSLEDLQALGLTELDLKNSRGWIFRHLFVKDLHDRSEASRLKLSFEMSGERPPFLREVTGHVEGEDDEGNVVTYELGRDDTAYLLPEGEVAGIWMDELDKLIPMLNMSEFYQRQVDSAVHAENGDAVHAENGDIERDEDGSEAGDVVANDEPEAQRKIRSALGLMTQKKWDEALWELDEARRSYDGGCTVDLGLEYDLLKAKARRWYGLGEYDLLLIEIERLLNLEIPGPRKWIKPADIVDPEVREWRQKAFKERRARQGRPQRPPPKQRCKDYLRLQDSLSDID